MSLSGVKRIESGIRLVEEVQKLALEANPHEVGDLFLEVTRTLFRDRPSDLSEALRALHATQREVNRRARETHLPKLPATPHKWMTIYSTRPVAGRGER